MRKGFIVVGLLTISTILFAQQRVLLSDFGISEKKDATPIIMEVLKKVQNKDAILVFPKGTYHFYPEKAYGKYHAVTNHDNSYKYFAFPLINCENIEIDGQGSDFIFHGVITPFLVENSQNIKLRNFSIDWEVPFFLQAEVVSTNPSKNIFDILLADFTPHKLEGNRLTFSSNNLEFPFLGLHVLYNPKTKAVAYNAESCLIDTKNKTRNVEAKKISENRYAISNSSVKQLPEVGMVYVFKGPNGINRMAPAIHLTESSKLDVENVTVYTACGMGLIAEKCENIHLNAYNVKLREGTNRILTTTADASHFCNCKGELLIENCYFENMLDDGCNVHGTYMRVSEIVNSKTLRARLGHYQQTDYNFAKNGDSIQFIQNKSILPIASVKLNTVQKINEKFYELTFDQDLPKTLKIDDGLENISWYPNLTFRNNTVINNRARSVLISNRNKTIIENNVFSSMSSSILFEGDMDNWHESGSVTDVLIRNNKFLDNAYGGGKGSVIWINPHLDSLVANKYYERNIRIENNSFETFDNSILRASSVKSLIFKNNIITPTTTYPKLNPTMPTIQIENSADALISGNKYEGVGKANIVTDSITAKTISIDRKQSGFK